MIKRLQESFKGKALDVNFGLENYPTSEKEEILDLNKKYQKYSKFQTLFKGLNARNFSDMVYEMEKLKVENYVQIIESLTRIGVTTDVQEIKLWTVEVDGEIINIGEDIFYLQSALFFANRV